MSFAPLHTAILTLFCIQTIVLSAAAKLADDVRDALKHAGENRGELETALRKVPSLDTNYLLTHTSQYDLVNLTAEQIVENVTYARKVRVSLPYPGNKLDDAMWRDWVLPHRVLDEDLSLCRKDFHERMQPIIAGKTKCADVAEAIHDWLLVPREQEPQLRFVYGAGDGEVRQMTPAQLLKNRKGACDELCMIYVYLLRAVGIPARHCSLGYYTSRDDGHLYCEYWDSQLNEWTAVDASVEYAMNRNPPNKRVETGNGVPWPCMPTRCMGSVKAPG